jgi:hypothetical protein
LHVFTAAATTAATGGGGGGFKQLLRQTEGLTWREVCVKSRWQKSL